jgi:phosphonatase-like hydrolase
MQLTRRDSLRIGAALAAQAGLLRAATGVPLKLVVLDLGGTIIQDRGDVPEAMISSCADHGIAIQPQDVAPLRGASKKEVIRRFVEERAPQGANKTSLAMDIYKQFNQQVIAAYQDVPPIDGAEGAFKEMRSAGLALAACTGFGSAVADSIFDRLKWLDYFVTTVTADDVATGRPAPFMIYHAMEAARVGSVAQVIAVGDTPLDIQAANNAGVRGIGVLSGAGNERTIGEAKPAAILKSVAELPAWIRSHA